MVSFYFTDGIACGLGIKHRLAPNISRQLLPLQLCEFVSYDP